MDAIFESLQREFCPPLDSSLLAALLAEIDLDSEDAPFESSPQIATLRSTLIELAQQRTRLLYNHNYDLCVGSVWWIHAIRPFQFSLGLFTSCAAAHPTVRLVQALSEEDTLDEELDMWKIISAILSEETENEMRERDLDEEDMKEIGASEASWETVETKRTARKTKKKAAKGSKITISDVRQQQHARPNLSRQRSEDHDPWAQLASLSMHVAQFLPPHPASFFSSFFHSPTHARTPYTALCAALTAICSASASASGGDTDTDADTDVQHTTTLFNLLDMLLPAYEASLDVDGRSRLIADVELALNAAQGRGADAYELVKVLRDLDSDAASGALPPLSRRLARTLANAVDVHALPAFPAATPPPPRLKPPPAAPAKGGSANPYQWQAVPPRRRATRTDAPYPHAMHIPAYTRDVNGVRVRSTGGNGVGKGGRGMWASSTEAEGG
ncbi:hypothetical protein B0H13DRAFT_2667680 [Mycena leptocephala]|nr:hypothetical protein B0H13DRAFT_2667680 [Mycena leptocephala]